MSLELIEYFKSIDVYNIVLSLVIIISFSLFLKRGGVELIVQPLTELYRRMKKRADAAEQLKTRLNTLECETKDLTDVIGKLDRSVRTLVDSDKDNIRSYLLDKHYYYFYVQKWIPIYHLDAIERKYNQYKLHDGNSFVHHLMEELRSLPLADPDDCGDPVKGED